MLPQICKSVRKPERTAVCDKNTTISIKCGIADPDFPGHARHWRAVQPLFECVYRNGGARTVFTAHVGIRFCSNCGIGGTSSGGHACGIGGRRSRRPCSDAMCRPDGHVLCGSFQHRSGRAALSFCAMHRCKMAWLSRGCTGSASARAFPAAFVAVHNRQRLLRCRPTGLQGCCYQSPLSRSAYRYNGLGAADMGHPGRHLALLCTCDRLACLGSSMLCAVPVLLSAGLQTPMCRFPQ